mmetsp:Transcript_67355/g.191129  ORF Transcript_67355/g.191129 Transcript_67355/m.191129 type:complete len:205 (+) Transcript_67355:445-1059(+)
MMTDKTIYIIHNETRKALETLAKKTGPPSSAPTTHRRTSRRAMQARAQPQNTATLGPSEPASTSKSSPLNSQYTAAGNHDNPRPRKTLTELLPVTLPMLLSAVGSCIAAVLEANVSGKEVPRATNVIAQIEGGMSRAHPSRFARSPMKAVQIPIMSREHAKHAFPPQNSVGGTAANSTFHGTPTTWRAQSTGPASAWDSGLPPT